MLASGAGLVTNLAAIYWLKTWGPLRSIKIFQFSMSLGLIAIGLSHSLWLIFVGIIFVGISFGGTGVTQNILVAWGANHKMRRKAYSVLHATYGFASLAAPFILILCYHFKFTWQIGFLFIGALSLLVNLWSFFVAEHANDPPFPVASFHRSQTPFRTILWFAGFNTLYVVSEILIGTRLVLLSRREWGLAADRADQLQSLFYFLLLLGRLTMSLFHFKTKTRSLMLASISLSLVVMCVGILTHPSVIALCGLTMSIFFPCAMAYTYEEQPQGADNIIAWTLALNSGGVLVMHWGVAWLSDWSSLKLAIWVGPICLSLCLVILLFEKMPSLNKVVSGLGSAK